MEYQSGTDAKNLWSVPLFYGELPFICISIIHMLFITIILGSGLIGGMSGYFNQRFHRKKLIVHTGTPDYETAQLMIKGKFTDYETFKKAQELNIASYDEYTFMLEQIRMEEEKDSIERKGN